LAVQFLEVVLTERSAMVHLAERESCNNRATGRQTLKAVALVTADDDAFHLQNK